MRSLALEVRFVAAIVMDSQTQPCGAAAVQADSAAATVRDTACDDSGPEGSRGSLAVLAVMWGELRVALWSSLVCAVTAAILAVPAGVVEFIVNDLCYEKLGGEGAYSTYALRDAARMSDRETIKVEFDSSTVTARWRYILSSVFEQTLVLFFFPVCFAAYLGASIKACSVMLGSAALAFVIASAGFMISWRAEFLEYSPGLGFALHIVALTLVCPRNSMVPRQAIKVALVLLLGNLLLLNVIAETTVRTQAESSCERCKTY